MGGRLRFPAVEIRPDADARFTLEMIQRGFLNLRLKAIKRYVTHYAAQQMLEAVKSKIPNGKQYAAYRDSLYLAQSGLPSSPVFSVAANIPRQEEIQKDTDILYIKPARKRGKVATEVAILMKYQPWTKDTLPFDVTPSQGKLLFRRVSAREVGAIAKAREADKPKWQQELSQIGIRPEPKKDRVPASTKATPDMAYLALRLEFGLGGTRAVAHWRPAIVTVRQRVTSMFKSGLLAKALLDWKNDDWRSWRNLSAPVVPSNKVADYRDFEDKIS